MPSKMDASFPVVEINKNLSKKQVDLIKKSPIILYSKTDWQAKKCAGMSVLFLTT